MITEQKIQQILTNTVKVFGNQEWFRNVSVHPLHEITNGPAIEFKVNYIPIMERKNVIAFAQAAGASYFFTIVDRNGNKVE